MNKKKTGRTAGKREKKQEPLFRRHGASVKIICAVLVTLALALGVKSVSLYEKREAYREQEAELEAQIEEEKARKRLKNIHSMFRVMNISKTSRKRSSDWLIRTK